MIDAITTALTQLLAMIWATISGTMTQVVGFAGSNVEILAPVAMVVAATVFIASICRTEV